MHGKKARPRSATAGRKAAGSGTPSGTKPSRRLADGVSDGFVPLRSLDLSSVRSVDDLVRGLGSTAFAGRAVGEAADVLEAMVRDPNCFVACTLSGAMTVAKMGRVLCEMIDAGWVQAVVSTGALMAHGFVEATGRTHFKVDPTVPDHVLYEKGYDRVYDTLELESNLDDVEEIVRRVLDAWDPATTMSSAGFHAALGAYLDRHVEGPGILKSAWRRGVPVYVPAFTDSELGLDVALQIQRARRAGTPPIRFDPFVDLEDFKERLLAADRAGIFTIGGGVPRNWAQQIGPYLEITQKRLGIEAPLRRFQYGVRICPEPAHWGGLSGCTYTEGVSWGKFVPVGEGGRYAEVLVDATVGWPLVVQAVAERCRKVPPPAKGFPTPPVDPTPPRRAKRS